MLDAAKKAHAVSGHRLSVSFITSELAEGQPDLIVAFAIVPRDDPMGLDNLILLRTPKFEPVLPPEERGVSVSYDGGADEVRGLLREFKLEGHGAQIRTDEEDYLLDLDKVDPKELGLMREVINRMNFDQAFVLEGV